MNKKQNIIWFVTDQFQGNAMGCAGDPNVFTPNMDNMAVAGSYFSRAVSGYPLCCPYRASMLTGKYAHNHSVRVHEGKLDRSYSLVSDVFNNAGYETVYLGKWHVAGLKERDGRSALQTVPREDRGRFDTWIGYDNNNSQFDCYVHGHDGDEEISHYKLQGYETDVLTDIAIDRLRERADDAPPMFMVISVQPPHWPCLAPSDNRNYQAQQLTLRPNVPATAEAEARIKLSGYYGQIENIDDNLGRLMGALQEENILEHTHVMFFSDHGDQMGSQGRFGKCVPFEESARVPFMIGGGTSFYDGWGSGTIDCPINHVDIAPTSLGLAGLEVPDWMEGFDYSHRRNGRNREERIAKEPDSAYLQLLDENRESGYPWRCVVTRDGWKYACVDKGEWLLFDLNNDPYEQNNLAFNTHFNQKREEMKRKLQSWIDRTGDCFPLPGLS